MSEIDWVEPKTLNKGAYWEATQFFVVCFLFRFYFGFVSILTCLVSVQICAKKGAKIPSRSVSSARGVFTSRPRDKQRWDMKIGASSSARGITPRGLEQLREDGSKKSQLERSRCLYLEASSNSEGLKHWTSARALEVFSPRGLEQVRNSRSAAHASRALEVNSPRGLEMPGTR